MQTEINFEEEAWKDIIGFEGIYEISNLGRIKSKERFRQLKSGNGKLLKEKILKPRIDSIGYWRISLYKNGKPKHVHIHRLIAVAFIDNPKNKPEVNHKDRNRANLSLNNLEWCTHKENIIHSFETGRNIRKGENHAQAKLGNNDVLQILNFIKYGMSDSEIANKFNVARTLINRIKNKRRWQHVL